MPQSQPLVTTKSYPSNFIYSSIFSSVQPLTKIRFIGMYRTLILLSQLITRIDRLLSLNLSSDVNVSLLAKKCLWIPSARVNKNSKVGHTILFIIQTALPETQTISVSLQVISIFCLDYFRCLKSFAFRQICFAISFLP